MGLSPSAVPGRAVPGQAVPGVLSALLGGTAFLRAAPVLAASASAGPDLAALWSAFLAASEAARNAELSYGMMRQAGGTDGSAGFLYGSAYEAQQAADIAYQSFLAAQQRARPGAGG